eukprot:UN00568
MGNETARPTSRPLKKGNLKKGNKKYATLRHHRNDSSKSVVRSDVVQRMIDEQRKKIEEKNRMKNTKTIGNAAAMSKKEEEDFSNKLTSTVSLVVKSGQNTTDKSGNITVGSYVTCDCDNVYCVVTEILPNNGY